MWYHLDALMGGKQALPTYPYRRMNIEQTEEERAKARQVMMEYRRKKGIN